MRALVTVVATSTVAAVLPAAFPATASATTSDHLVFSTQPGDADPGSPLAVQPVVSITSSDGTTDTGASSDITLSLTAVSLSGTYVRGALSGCSVSTTKGVATATGCQVSAPGKYTLTASDATDGITTTSDPFFVSGAAQLVFTTPPGGGNASTAWATQPVVTVEDAHGNPLANTHEVGVAIQGGTGTAGATLTCDNDGTAANVIAFSAVDVGAASYSNCSIDKSGSAYQLYAVDPTDHLVSAPSTAFAVTSGAVTQLAFTSEPGGANGGAALSSQPIVSLEDAGGNVVASADDHVTLAITAGSGALDAALTCTASDVAATSGVATFAGCAVDKVGSYNLTATDSTADLTVVSTSFSVTTGAAARIDFSTPPAGGASGSALSTQPVVTLTDRGGNPVAGAVTLALASGPAGAVLSCASNPVGTAGAAATFSGCSIDRPGTYTLTATAGALSATSSSFSVGAGTASAVAFHAAPAATGNTGGTPFSAQPVVTVTDAGGQSAEGSVRLSIADGTGAAGARLACASNPVATINGAATFSGCSIDAAAAGYRLVATLVGTPSATSTSGAFGVDVGPAAQLAVTAGPSAATGGVPFATQPVVTVMDAGGNPVASATGNVTLTVTPGTGSGTLTCQDGTVALQLGRALFANCSIDVVAAAYTLTATWGARTAVSAPFPVTAGPATALRFTHQPAGGAGTVGQTTVAFVDVGGNVTTHGAATVALSLTSGTGTAGASLASCSGGAATDGTATFTGCSVDKTGGGYTLTAKGGGLSTESLPFAVTPAAPTVGVTPAGGIPLAQTFGGTAYGVNATNTVDDVNTATGALSFASTDLRVAGIGRPFVLARTYNSADTTGGLFGPGWTSVFDISVTVVPGHTATVRGEDGQQTVYTWDTRKGWVAPAGARGSLSCGGFNSEHCRYTRTDGSSWDVLTSAPGGGQLQDYRAADGYGLTFLWTASRVFVTLTAATFHPYVVTATVVNHRITSVATPAGRTIGYRYDAAGELTSVTDGAGRTWTYTYSGGRLTSQADGDGHLRLTATYDASGRVATAATLGSVRHTSDSFSYGGNGVTTRTAQVSIGGVLQPAPYTYTYVGNFLTAQTEPSGATTRYSYDASGNLVTVLDPLGWAQTMTYDAGNNMTSQRSPLSTVTMTYDSNHRVLSTTDADGNTTTDTYDGPMLHAIFTAGSATKGNPAGFVYNYLGELILVISPQGQQVYGYDAFGNQTSSHLLTRLGAPVDGPGTTSSYDEAGNRLSATDADGNTTKWTYDASGDLMSVTSPAGTTTYAYTGGADIRSVTGAGQTTTYTWDEASLTRTTSVNGTASTETYDPSGNLLRHTAGGATTTNAYDRSGELVATTDASAITTRYTYDLGGNAVLMTNSAGDTLSREYDANHHVIRQVLDGAVTTTAYDPAGNVVSTTDAAGHTTTSKYGVNGKVASVHTAAGTTSYGYDAVGNLISTTDPAGHVTSYTYDAANRRTAMQLGNAVTRYGYDRAGNPTSVIDPDGRVTTYTLDALARPVKTTFSGTGTPYSVTQSFDALGRRTQLVDPTGTHTYSYDTAGHLTSETYAGDTFSYDYSTPGKIAETYPDGTHVTYTVDDSNNVMDITSGVPGSPSYVHASYLRNAQRLTTGIAYANGLLETRQLNQAGQVLDQQLSVGGSVAADDRFTYDTGDERLTQIDNVGGQVVTNAYGYDGAGRVTGFSTATSSTSALAWPTVTPSTVAAPTPTSTAGVTPPLAGDSPVTAAAVPTVPTTYAYDADGNLVSAAGGASTMTYNASDELVSSAGTGGAKSSTYDAAGNLTSVTTSAGTERFTYDLSGHLVSVKLPSGALVTYTYDGDGNRVTKTANGTTTRYVWDPASGHPQLDIEKTSAGSLIRRYFYGDGPVAMQTSAATYYYSLDPQGSVVELTDAHGQLAAAYHYDAYGAVTTVGPSAPANPLLFQGGYLDADTGLYALGARNYDPSTGRFSQRDPLQRAAGMPSISAYTFADDRPTVFADPTGLFPTAAQVFWTHDSVEANGGTLANYGVTAANVTYKVGKQFVAFVDDPKAFLAGKWSAIQKAGSALKAKVGSAADYIKDQFSSSTTTAEEELAGSVGEVAPIESEIAETAGIATAEGGEAAAEAGEVLSKAGTAAKVGGVVVGVIGIGLQTFITVEDCLHDTVQKCVGDAVGTAVSLTFLIVCTVATEGVGAVLCGIAGAAIAVALQTVITMYGPQIAAGLVTAYQATAQGLTDAANAIADFATNTADTIATGWNSAVSAISTGFADAMSTLVNAGYTAVQLASVLAHQFVEGVDAAVNALVGFGYSIADVATALATSLAASLGDAALVLKNTFDYTVTQVSDALQSAYSATAAALGTALKGAAYAVDEIATGLKSAYAGLVAGTDAAVATVLQGLNYGVNQVAAALQDVYHDADVAVSVVLAGLSYTADQVSGALVSLYHDVDSAVASALAQANYAVDAIAGALNDVLHDAAATAAALLQGLNDGVDEIAHALDHVYALGEIAVTQILHNLAYTANEVAGALVSAYNAVSAAVAGALYDVGYAVDVVSNALKATYASLAADAAAVASLLYDAGYTLANVATALKDTFAEADAAVVHALDTLTNDLSAAATAVGQAFTEGEQAVALAITTAGYTIVQLTNVLQSAYAETAQGAAQVLKALNVAVSSIVDALAGVYGEAENEIASILNSIGEAVSDIAGALENFYNQAASAVAGVLSDIGISSATIDAIGGAFSDFGNAVASGVTDAWNTVTSWF